MSQMSSPYDCSIHSKSEKRCMDCSFRVFSNGGTLVKEEEKIQKVKEKVDKKLRKMWFGQVMSPYHSDQMSQRLQFSWVTL